MYKLNYDRLINKSESIEKGAEQLDDCIYKLKAFEAALSALNSDEELTLLTQGLREKIESQQQNIRQLSYVLSAVSNTIILTSKQEVTACERDSELQKCLVLNLLGNSCNKVDPTSLPITLTISN